MPKTRSASCPDAPMPLTHSSREQAARATNEHVSFVAEGMQEKFSKLVNIAFEAQPFAILFFRTTQFGQLGMYCGSVR